jgi:hypothetical protein
MVLPRVFPSPKYREGICKSSNYRPVGAKNKLVNALEKGICLESSDVVMPDMDGYELALIVSEKYPTLKNPGG